MELHSSANARDGATVITPVVQGQSITNLTINIASTLNESADEQQLTISDKLLEDLKDVHKSALINKFEHVSDCIAKYGKQPLLKDLFTDVLVTESGSGDETLERKTSCSLKRNEIFKSECERKNVRTVLTKGIAGIGKTVYVQKFIFDWASGESNQEFDFVCVFPFRELNLLRKEISLVELMQQYYPHMKRCENILSDGVIKFLFVFDGLDESRHQLDFYKCPPLEDERKAASMDVLLTNIIRGNLLSQASIWITSRSSAANQIPANVINRVTEIQGFDDKEREEYFRKKCKNTILAAEIVAHIKAHRSLYLMCYVPSFCWVLACVFEQTLARDGNGYLPRTLAEIYTKFLIVVLTFQNQKYDDQRRWTDYSLLESNRDAILNLGRLAFEHLEKSNVIFYEQDLIKYGIHMSQPSVFTGVCKEIFLENSVSLQESVYSFAHLTLQEYFAALYVFISYQNKKLNVLRKTRDYTFSCVAGQPSLRDVFRIGLKKSLLSKSGHLDVFVRFLLGVSTEHSQNLLNGLLLNTEDNSDVISQTTEYIKDLIRSDISPERCINLFHCLNELNDNFLVEELKTSLNSGQLSKAKLSPSQYSALAYIFQMSPGETDELNLRKYRLHEEGVIRMLPVAKLYKRLSVEQCCLTARSCVDLAFVLRSHQSRLRQLELGWNILQDAGVKLLCAGLADPSCKLRRLGLKQCGLTKVSSEYLASVLCTNHASLRELELMMNQIEDDGLKKLSTGLTHPNCKLQKLGLRHCGLTAGSCQYLSSSLCRVQSSLRELVLSRNTVGDDGVKILSEGLKDPQCQLQTLKLEGCGLTPACCEDIASVFCTNHSSLTELDLKINGLEDSGLDILCWGLRNPNCKIKNLGLEFCRLTARSCESLVCALSATQSNLQELDLNANNLGDSGVEFLSAGLKNPNCRLQTLRLRSCGLTSRSCKYLALAVGMFASTLKELDLSDNEMGDDAVEFLAVAMKNPNCKLQQVCLAGSQISWALKGELVSVLAELRQSGKDMSFKLNNNEIL
uniref:Si:dkeyp-4c4.1 n=2 Tax=Lepisosteus oculatus TaxID=7918 RepID=W5M1V7_LEPOC